MRIRTTTAPHATPPPNPDKYSNIQQSWRVARGDSAPLSVTGLLSGGVRIRVMAAWSSPTAALALILNPMPPMPSPWQRCGT